MGLGARGVGKKGWFGERAAEKTGTKDSDELANSIQLENQRKADREIEMGFGKVYVMVIHAEDWWTTLPAYKQVAFVIAAAAVAVATTCFILSAALPKALHLLSGIGYWLFHTDG